MKKTFLTLFFNAEQSIIFTAAACFTPLICAPQTPPPFSVLTRSSFCLPSVFSCPGDLMQNQHKSDLKVTFDQGGFFP